MIGKLLSGPEQAARWQQVLRGALERLDWRRFGPADGHFYDEFRAAMLAAGATEHQIDQLAAYQGALVAAWSADDEARDEQHELISEHLAAGRVRFRMAPEPERCLEVSFLETVQ